MDGSVQFESERALEMGAGSVDPTVYKYCAEIKMYDDEFKEYYTLCNDIKAAYRDDKAGKKRGRYNVLWSNLENLKPSILFNVPKVEIERKYKDKDALAREASNILERASQFCIETYPFMAHAERARDEYLLYGRAALWTRYEANFENFETKVPVMQTDFGFIEAENGQPVKDPESIQLDPQTNQLFYVSVEEDLAEEYAKSEFLHRDNFGHNMAKTWEEVYLVWKKVYLTRDELIERFGEEVGAAVPLNYVPEKMREKDDSEQSIFKKAEVFECWDKKTKKVTWICKDYKDKVLDQKDDPLKLYDFFPCSVIYATIDTDSLVPRPDFAMYESISNDLNTVSSRISALTRAVRLKGFYPKVLEELAKMASGGAEFSMHPIENYERFLQMGGINKIVEWLPIEQIAGVLRYMYEVKDRLKQDLYEISGQSDILRGQTDPRETATAQRGKMQYASLRLNQRQKNFSLFLRDAIRKKGEIIAEQFEDKTLYELAAISALGQESQQLFPQAVQLLRDDKSRRYRIDIETDSTIAQDDQEAQQNAVDFFNALTQGFNDSLPIIQNVPEAAEVLTEGLSLVARTFRAGRSLDSAIEKMGEALRKKAEMMMSQPPPQAQGQAGQPQGGQAPQGQGQPPPNQIDPRIIVAQSDGQLKREKMQQEAAMKQADLQMEAKKSDDNVQIELLKLQQNKEEMKAKMMLEGIKQGHGMGML